MLWYIIGIGYTDILNLGIFFRSTVFKKVCNSFWHINFNSPQVHFKIKSDLLCDGFQGGLINFYLADGQNFQTEDNSATTAVCAEIVTVSPSVDIPLPYVYSIFPSFLVYLKLTALLDGFIATRMSSFSQERS